MRLHAALLPPPDVQDDLAATVASVPGGDEQLTLVPAHLLHLRLASFGKVTLDDAHAVKAALQKEVAQWPPMKFRFRGGAALEPIGDDCAWAKLEGDTDQLSDVADLAARVVKRLGFLVDRRLPRTLVRVGRIKPATTADYLQQMIDRLDAYASPEWTCQDLAMLRASDTTIQGFHSFEVQDHIRLKEVTT